MSEGDFPRLKELLGEALDRPASDRVAYLKDACGDDLELLSEALALIVHDQDDVDPTVRYEQERTDTEIGPYRLLERLGEGAMGEVWRAEQREPIKRIVALKIIKRGMDTRELVTRFEIERQAMALMDHPWIAKVYDAGQTPGGRPYIAMEYVMGEKLTDYCARNRLSIEDRLRLFQKICQAIQHAHQKAVIHRDLKPSNILVAEVDGEPVPKIIDFGIAKATAQRLTDRSAATFVGQLIGTPLYMSPEQVEMSSAGVDTRADVYSLGVILYELISGVLPHDPERFAKAALGQVLRMLREEDPARPSTRVSTLGDRAAEITAQRGLDKKRLVGKLRGDLDWITLKALERDRKRRYDTPRDLADDIRRHLNLEAIQAHPPSAAYWTSRFLRRHTFAVTSVTIVLISLVAFAIWQTVQSDIIARERDRAMANERLSLAREHLDTDPTAAVAFAIASLEILDQPGARDVVRKAIARAPLRDEWPRYGQRGNPITVDTSFDGRYCAVAWSQTKHPTIGVYDTATLSQRIFQAPTLGIAYWVGFNADATLVIGHGSDGMHAWRVADGEHLWHVPEPEGFGSTLLHASDNAGVFILSGNARGERTNLFRLDLSEGSLVALGITAGRHGLEAEWHQPAVDRSLEWILDYDGSHVFMQRFDDLNGSNVRIVGEHDAPVSSVAMDRAAETAATADIQGTVIVWDLTSDPPKRIREYQEQPGTFQMEFDPGSSRFFAALGTSNLSLYDLSRTPNRRRLELFDRGFWTHDGAFLPDGSVISCRNGLWTGPLSHWRLESPWAWTLEPSASLGPGFSADISRDGRRIYLWGRNGVILGMPLVSNVDSRVGPLAQSSAWATGSESHFSVSDNERRAVTFSGNESAARVVDLITGEVEFTPDLDGEHTLSAVSQNGKWACFVEVENDHALRIIDLDSLAIAAELNVGGPPFLDTAFQNNDILVGVTSKHIVRFDVQHASAAPDTLWEGDAQGASLLLDDGRSAVVRDREMRTTWIDLAEGRTASLGVVPYNALRSVAFNAQLKLLAIAGFGDYAVIVDVNDLRRWQLPTPPDSEALTVGVMFDPLGRWLLTQHLSRCVAWRLPLDPLLSDPDHESLLATLRSRTNVRVVPDESEPSGFGISNTMEPAR